ncbi:MAG: NTP transferase domain-containing protein [Candidatus Tectomicrobia bacterium]
MAHKSVSGNASASIRAFVQARMLSRRFPGKVLAPFQGKPLIQHVLIALERALPSVQIVVATSDHDSDDPLAAYLSAMDVAVFRGPLDNVFERFRMCVSEYPCEWILRVSADSPLLDGRVLRAVVERANDWDGNLISTIFPRTFPRGQNTELIRVDIFLTIGDEELSEDDREHVTPIYYRHPHRFQILNVESGNPKFADLSLAVDTVEDLQRLEKGIGEQEYQLTYSTLATKPG